MEGIIFPIYRQNTSHISHLRYLHRVDSIPSNQWHFAHQSLPIQCKACHEYLEVRLVKYIEYIMDEHNYLLFEKRTARPLSLRRTLLEEHGCRGPY